MTDSALTFLLSQPQRITLVGRIFYRCAAFQVLAGVVAQLMTTAMRQAHASYRGIGDVMPDLPTWWIPETVLGMIGVTLLAAMGLAIAYSGRQFERQYV